MSSESYVLNDKLRRGIKLSADEQEWAKSLDSALDKMPEYKGTVYRSVSDFGIENLDAFIKSHALDEAKVFSSYISTSKSVYDESFPIQYVIESKHGRDISALNSQEQEILFNRNSVFRIVMDKKPYSDRRWWDNPMPISSLCNNCGNWLGRGKCKKYKDKVPREILNKSFPGTENFEENYCGYREEKTAE